MCDRQQWAVHISPVPVTEIAVFIKVWSPTSSAFYCTFLYRKLEIRTFSVEWNTAYILMSVRRANYAAEVSRVLVTKSYSACFLWEHWMINKWKF